MYKDSLFIGQNASQEKPYCRSGRIIQYAPVPLPPGVTVLSNMQQLTIGKKIPLRICRIIQYAPVDNRENIFFLFP